MRALQVPGPCATHVLELQHGAFTGEPAAQRCGFPDGAALGTQYLLTHDDTFSISALHLSIKVPYFSNSGHKNEKVTSYLAALGLGIETHFSSP
eukprot:SAG31_NODE_5154_length_2712_cov_1.642174_4_plen_93_part_01